MKRLYSLLLSAAMFFSVFTPSKAQDDLDIFGYFQVMGSDVRRTRAGATTGHTNSFSVQQLNIFMNKNLSSDFSALVNMEIINSFSSERNWGAFNLEEAWLKYTPNDAFTVKAGLLLPRFNALNEIKNKTPLLPYILRPIVYEASLSGALNLEAFVPHRAFLQVYGKLPLGDAKFDYAVFAGNADRLHLNGGTSGQRGVDTTTYKLIGGRVGVSMADLKVGVSSTYDRANLKAVGLGEVPRIRIGADLSYSIAGFTLDGELILVDEQLSDSQQQRLDSISAIPTSTVGSETKKTFYYATLAYNISSDLYAYVQYNNLIDKYSKSFSDGAANFAVGAGYRPVEQVVLKVQYIKLDIPKLDSQSDYILGAASIFF